MGKKKSKKRNIKEEDKINPQSQNTVSFTCQQCKKIFNTPLSRDKHQLYAHNMGKLKENKKKTAKVGSENERENKLLLFEKLRDAKPNCEFSIISQFLQPNAQDLSDIFDRVKKDLITILRERFNDVDVFVYGSAISGLALRDSDFDFFVNIKDIIPEDIKITMRKIYGDFCQKRTFTKIIPILQARTPILKCTHIVTGFSCDINFTNSRGIYNSNIIRFLLQYDKNQRIYFLAIVLKYWAKVYNLSGTGKITNYALIMMLVFFLQSLREPILPPLIDFQKNTQEIIIDHWNFGWNFNFKYITKNTMTIVELLAEFFEFYNSYDFEKNIICPLIGRPLKKTDFVNQINSTNLIFKRYFEYIHIPVNGNNNNKPNELNMSPAICIQDAFEMSHNIASSCGKANFATFKLALAGAVKVCKEHEKSPMKTSELLIQLLSIEIVIGKDEMKRIASGLFSQTYNPSQARKFMCKLNSLAVELKLTNEYATILNKSDELPKKTEIQQIWAQTLMEYIPNLLEKMFFFEVNQLNQSDIDEKDRKCDGLILNENSIKFYALKASVNIWTNHRVNRNANLLTTEQRILSDKYTKAECATNLDCDMIIRFPTNNNFCEILFTDKLTEGQEMMKFFEFFILNIRSYFTAYLTQKLNDIKNVKKN